jgi:hypothetical protein
MVRVRTHVSEPTGDILDLSEREKGIWLQEGFIEMYFDLNVYFDFCRKLGMGTIHPIPNTTVIVATVL